MENTCNSDSITCKVVSGISAVVVSAILCGILKHVPEKLINWLENDIGGSRKNRVTPCFSVSDHSAIAHGDDGHVEMVGIPTNTVSHTGLQMNAGNAWPTFASTEVSSPMYSSTTTVIYNNGTVTMPSHTVIQQRLVPQHQTPPRLTTPVSEHSHRTQNMDQVLRGQQNTQTSSESPQVQQRESQQSKNYCSIVWRIIYFFLMSIFLYDWCIDMILSVEYFQKGEIQNFLLTFAPCVVSVSITTPFLLCIAAKHPGMSCLYGLLLVVVSPFAKVFIYGWIVVFGEQSWYQRWYLHALTLLQLAEVCIEGIPQVTFEGDLFLSENQTFYKGIGRTEIWAMVVSLIAVSVSITSVTTTLDREEDVRETYDEILKGSNSTKDEEYYWERYKTENTFLWYFNAVVVFFGKSFEYIPRCIIYIMFAEEFGLKALSYFIGMYLVIYFCFSVFCLKTIITNDKSIQIFALMSTVVGAFANLFFCYEWLFRLRWAKKYFYFRYYILFYAINLALGISNMLSSGKIDFHIAFGFLTVFSQPLLFLLRMWLREKMSENIK